MARIADAMRYAEPALKLADDPWRLERRIWNRRSAQGQFTAVFQGEERRGVLPLIVVDTSINGLGGLSPVQLTPGTRISLCAGSVPVAVRTGTVVRCEAQAGEGWRVGLKLDAKLCA